LSRLKVSIWKSIDRISIALIVASICWSSLSAGLGAVFGYPVCKDVAMWNLRVSNRMNLLTSGLLALLLCWVPLASAAAEGDKPVVVESPTARKIISDVTDELIVIITEQGDVYRDDPATAPDRPR